jgi:glycosyltransferase involved in cell wall biosynthesis
MLFTTGDSTCPVPLSWMYPHSLGAEPSGTAEVHHVDAAYEQLMNKVDVIHDHTVLGPRRLLSSRSQTPVVATTHNPFTPETIRSYELIGRRLPLVAISQAQAERAPAVPVRAVIHHGVDTGSFPEGKGDGGYAAFLGRMSPDKGPHRAIAVARAAGVPIRLAAKIWDPAEREFFEAVVRPLLGPDAIYVGEVGGSDKLDLLAGAEVLINPIRWPEPFGLVMIEAMASGTPVVSFRAGAAPEIVTNGVNGFLCEDEAEMADAVGRAGCLDRAQCRASVEPHFSAQRMVDDYVQLYRAAIADLRLYQGDCDRPSLALG